MTIKFGLKKKTLSGAVVLLVVALLVSGAASVAAGASMQEESGCTGTPTISSFYVNPSTIQPGETAVLSWGMVYGAERAILMAPGQKTGVATPGEMSVQPDHTTTYTLEAACGKTKVRSQVTVNVVVPPCSGSPAISSFTAEPMIIEPGQTSKLSWGLVGNAEIAVLVTPEGKEGVGTPGERVVQPGRTTTYLLEAFCGNEVTTRYITVAVQGAHDCRGTPKISYFYAAPSVIKRGASSSLEYGLVSNASGAYLRGPAGIIGIATPGQTTVQPDKTSLYRLYAVCGDTIIQRRAKVFVE